MTNISSQAGLFDRVIDDEKLITELSSHLTVIMESKQAMKVVSRARRKLKARFPDLELKDGERVRVGRFVIEGRTRGGGGIEIPAWQKVVPYRVTMIGD